MTADARLAPPAPAREYSSESQLALACLTIAAGGLLLGLQLDANGELAGTGMTALGIGAVVAIAAAVSQAASSGAVPRDAISILSALCGFGGAAFLVSGVIAPGGGWMLCEIGLLLWLCARRGFRFAAAPGAIVILALMFLFRLWITYQGSQLRWEVLSIEIPILSWIPLPGLEPIQSVSLGAFTPAALGFPPAGVNFAVTSLLWSAGIALCVLGLWWRGGAAVEYENDRIHATIHSLPPSLALVVEKLLPEEEWRARGLHGLSERRRGKRIETLVHQRIAARQEFNSAFGAFSLFAREPEDAFESEIHAALARYAPLEIEAGESDTRRSRVLSKFRS